MSPGGLPLPCRLDHRSKISQRELLRVSVIVIVLFALMPPGVYFGWGIITRCAHLIPDRQ
jgi:hypothetical protein